MLLDIDPLAPVASGPAHTPAPRSRPAEPAIERASFLDLQFGLATQGDVLHTIAARPRSAPFAYVVTPNVDHLVRLQFTRSDLFPAYRQAWLTLCDSRILHRLAQGAGLQLPVVPGSDLTAALFERVIRPGDPVAILGGSPSAIAELRERYGLSDLAHYDPPMGFAADPAQFERALAFLLDARARYVFLAVGSPQQELLAYQLQRRRAATGTGFCIGASLDFLTGRQSRAPRVIQRLSLEWLYRLLSNPQRLWRRYLLDGPLIFRAVRSWHARHPQPA
jgi:N-acetylglucosaminyldiphosphoundecaprenol N-acetyl-beta-D-mannosaminyltransferase